MSKEKKQEIRSEVRELADDLKSLMKSEDPKAGRMRFSFKEDPIEEHILEGTGVDMKSLKKFQKKTQNFTEALALATGELTNESAKEDTDIQTGEVDVKLGQDRINVHYDPIVRPPEDSDLDPEYGQVLVTYRHQGLSNKNGMMGVKSHLAKQAKELLS